MEGRGLGTSAQFDTFGFTAVELARKQADKEQQQRLAINLYTFDQKTEILYVYIFLVFSVGLFGIYLSTRPFSLNYLQLDPPVKTIFHFFSEMYSTCYHLT